MKRNPIIDRWSEVDVIVADRCRMLSRDRSAVPKKGGRRLPGHAGMPGLSCPRAEPTFDDLMKGTENGKES